MDCRLATDQTVCNLEESRGTFKQPHDKHLGNLMFAFLCTWQGCKTLNAAKPDPSYVCITLETGPGRWAAWGLDGASREDVGIKMTTSGAGADLYTEAVQQSLRRKVAAAGFVNSTPLDDSNVFLKVYMLIFVSMFDRICTVEKTNWLATFASSQRKIPFHPTRGRKCSSSL